MNRVKYAICILKAFSEVSYVTMKDADDVARKMGLNPDELSRTSKFRTFRDLEELGIIEKLYEYSKTYKLTEKGKELLKVKE